MSHRFLTREITAANVHWPLLVGRGAAEAGSLLLATRLVPLVETVSPKNYDRLKEKLAHVIEPHLAWYEKHILGLPAFSDALPAEKKAGTAGEKAKIIASSLVDFSAMCIGALVGQMATQGLADHMLGLEKLHDPHLDPKSLKANLQHIGHLATPVLLDKALNVSLVGVMQLGVPKQTEAITNDTSTMLEKTLGIPPKTTQYFLQWHLPNLVGFAASTALMTKKYRDVLGAQTMHHG